MIKQSSSSINTKKRSLSSAPEYLRRILSSLHRIINRLRRLIAGALCPERNTFERLANTDTLTGVASRRALDLALPAAEQDPHTRVVVFDADNFGEVNKACGHSAGDELLRQVALSITGAAERFRLGVRVFRRGGDEFVVLAPEVAAYLIRDAAEADFGVVTPRAGLHVSISGTVGRTFAEADAALQARKAAMKSGATAVDERMEVQA